MKMLLWHFFVYLAEFDLALAHLGGNKDWIASARASLRELHATMDRWSIQS